MDMLNVNRSTSYAATYTEPVKKTNEKDSAAQNTQQEKVQPKDEFVKNQAGTSVTYSKNTTKTSANDLMKMQQQRMDSFTRMLQSMVAKQGEKSNLTLFGMRLNVTQADSNAAAASIAPGGEYSVDAVAGRILDMAKALAGGDESKISALRTAVQKGFKAAGVDLGGKLPSICNDTYDQVMKGFDDWEKSFSTAAE